MYYTQFVHFCLAYYLSNPSELLSRPLGNRECTQGGQGYKVVLWNHTYHQTSYIRGTLSLNVNVSRLVLQIYLLNPLNQGVNSSMKIPVGAAPTTSEWSTMLLPTEVRLIESIKTTSMEDVSTIVLNKINNIQEGKTKKWSNVSRHI